MVVSRDTTLLCGVRRPLVNGAPPGFPRTVIGGKLEDGERITDALWNTTTELNLRSLYALSEHTKCTHIAKTWRARPLPRDERRDRRQIINDYRPRYFGKLPDHR